MISADLLETRFDQGIWLRRITNRIRRLVELQEILDITVAEIRSFLAIDRVKIYQFHADGSGQVMSESVELTRLPSLLGLNFPADDIPAEARDLFVQAQVRSIVDVEQQQIGQSVARDNATGEFLFEDIRYRPVDPCHVEYLTAMGVKASLTIPLMDQDQLWGLLVAHHAEPYPIPEHQLQSVQLVVDQLCVAITQSTLLSQAREKVEREATIARVATLLHSLSTIELDAALAEAVSALQGCGGRLYVYSEVYSDMLDRDRAVSYPGALRTYGTQPTMPTIAKYPLIEQYSVWQRYFPAQPDRPWAIADLYQLPSWRNLHAAFRSTVIRGVLIVPLYYRQQMLGFLTIFRDSPETETLWAGHVDPDQRQSYPRTSFEVWRQWQQGQIREWTADDVALSQALGFYFAAALHQYAIHQQLHTLNASLESQVQRRTTELQRATEQQQQLLVQTQAQAEDLQQVTEQQQLLFEVVTKMRQSLDLDTIFATVTQEVRRVLATDRVGIYRFDPASAFNDGEFIAEDVAVEFPSAIAIKVHDHCFGEVYADYYRHGRVYAIEDVETAGLQDCFAQLLNRFQVKATLVAPLMKDDELWGLFCIHHCRQSRQWEASEVQFATQVAMQLGVALEQSDRLTQTRQQAEQLAQTLQELQATQTQLIQTEKMSTLGQLVAGVAHEINNPVNFIHGNLNYLNDYIAEILELSHLMQQQRSALPAELQSHLETLDLDFLLEDLPKMLSSMKLGTERIRQIVLSLRSFSRLDQADMKPVDIHEGLDSTLLILQHRLKAKSNTHGIELIKEYGELPWVECYAGQLNQVFMNLLSNAIDALEDSQEFFDLNSNFSSLMQTNQPVLPILPTIRIRTTAIYPDRVQIAIADNGAGMTAEICRKLFSPFFTTKPAGKGTGLGLSISYQIITEKHGGKIWCQSAPGQGAEFIIELPVRSS